MSVTDENYVKSVLRRFNNVDRVFALTCVYHFSYDDAVRIAKDMENED